MSETPTPLLTIEGLRIGFGTGLAVDGIDLAVGSAEIVALVGESGSGKSITAKAILGLLPEAASVQGNITLLNGTATQLRGLEDRSLRSVRGAHISMVFQEPSTALNPVETVGWQLAEALRAHQKIRRADARHRAIEMLELVGIPEPELRIDHYPHQLSGGQQQRVVIALALANEPAIVVADEPTTALDVTIQAEILRLLSSLRERLGTSILLITHDMGVVAEIADRVVVLRAGRVVETGNVHEIFANPQANYTKELLAAVPRLTVTGPTMADENANSYDTDNIHDPDDADNSKADSKAVRADDYAIRFTDLRVEYGKGRPAVDHVNLNLQHDEILGLVGESGSGKSTLGRVAVGLIRPTLGDAYVLGTDISTATRKDLRTLRKRIGVVFQDPTGSLDPRQSVADSVAEPLRVHRLGEGEALRSRVLELLDAVRLPAALADRRPSELSGGQRQRVGLARALALGPELLIADEATSALDVSVQATILELFDELHTELGFACLFISHDLAVVEAIADRVAVLLDGHVVEVGNTDTVLRTPIFPYTKRLIESVPIPDPAVRERRGASLRVAEPASKHHRSDRTASSRL